MLNRAQVTRAAWQQHPGVAVMQGAEAGLPWEQSPHQTSADQEGWLLSFVDVLTLLLTLFVLLLAYQHEGGEPERPTGSAAVALQPASAAPAAEPAASPARTAEPVAATPEAKARIPEPDPVAAFPPLQYFDAPPADPDGAEELLLQWLWRERPETEPAAGGVGSSDPVDRLLAALGTGALRSRIEVRRQPGGVDLEISDSVLFAPASADLTKDGERLLDQLAIALRAEPYALSVEGHTDDVPIATDRYPSNWELSAARATRVTRHLLDRGLVPDRVRAIGYADTRALADNASAEGRARNRRVSFVLRTLVAAAVTPQS